MAVLRAEFYDEEARFFTEWPLDTEETRQEAFEYVLGDLQTWLSSGEVGRGVRLSINEGEVVDE